MFLLYVAFSALIFTTYSYSKTYIWYCLKSLDREFIDKNIQNVMQKYVFMNFETKNHVPNTNKTFSLNSESLIEFRLIIVAQRK